MTTYIHGLNQGTIVRNTGPKAVTLRTLARKGYRVPKTWCCTYDGYDAYINNRNAFLKQITEELKSVIDPDTAYAVRSAANVEDTGKTSFAGQFESVLSVSGLEEVVDAVTTVFDSAHSSQVAAYAAASSIDPSGIRMSVVIQEMVTSVLSGVGFSRHPLTGLDEVVIEAAEGTGESILQGGADPLRWVYKWGTFTESPSDSPWEETVRRVVRDIRSLELACKAAVDVEWAYDGTDLTILQARPISLNFSLNYYSNRLTKELLPGIIKPLVWSTNIPLVNGGWISIIERIIGSTGVNCNDLAKQFHYRAYFNMKAMGTFIEKIGMPRESLEILMGIEGGEDKPSMRPGPKVVAHLPRLVLFFTQFIGINKRVDRLMDAAGSKYDLLLAEYGDSADLRHLLAGVDALWELNDRVVYYNILAPLFMSALNMLLKRKAQKVGVDYNQIALKAPGVEQYDPNPSIQQMAELFSNLQPGIREAVARTGYQGAKQVHGTEELLGAFERFITRFGHLSDRGNDFTAPPWREQPNTVFEMILSSKPNSVPQEITQPVLPAATKKLKRIIKRTQTYVYMREKVSFTYTKGYGLFRNFYMAIGRVLARDGLIAEPEDVFYVTVSEIRGVAEDANVLEGDLKRAVSKRKREIASCTDTHLPEIIYGEDPPPIELPGTHIERLNGMGTSGGYYEGSARIINSVSEFSRVQSGDVIIIPYSEVSWTSLFSKAGAVVSESGGILSHSSIVAREYGIPCVVAVKNAMRIPAGERISVDGYTGEVRLIKETV